MTSKSLIEVEMADVGLFLAQGIDNQHLHPLETVPSVSGENRLASVM